MFGHELKSFYFCHLNFLFFGQCLPCCSVLSKLLLVKNNINNSPNRNGVRNRCEMLSPVTLQLMINWADGISFRRNGICTEIHDIVWLHAEIPMSRRKHRIRSMFPLKKRWQRETSIIFGIMPFYAHATKSIFFFRSVPSSIGRAEKKSFDGDV